MQIFYSSDISEDRALLIEDEAGHCARVLRKRVGDTVHVTDGHGSVYEAEVSSVSKKEVELSSLSLVDTQSVESHLTVAIAPTKNIARYEWFLEKATEIGIRRIIPIVTARSERKVIKPQRLEKILLSAMKQSKNYHLPELMPLMSYGEMLVECQSLPQKYIAHCMEPDRHLSTLYNADERGVVLVGPEGDFTQEEVGMAAADQWQEVSLGMSRLRTETAGIVATHIVSLLSQNIK